MGFGTVRPAEISFGGDPTGVLTGVTWQSWGGAQATGTGTSTYVAPGQTVAQGTQETATVVASGLGTCKGAPAYQQVVWYFPPARADGGRQRREPDSGLHRAVAGQGGDAPRVSATTASSTDG